MNPPNDRSSSLDGPFEGAPFDVSRLEDELDREERLQAERLLERAFGEDASAGDPPAEGTAADHPGSLIRALAVVLREIDRLEADRPVPEVAALRREVTRASEEMLRELVEQRVRPWREMLRDVTHDVRSPLNSILFLAEGLYNEHSGPLEPAQREQLGIVYSAAASLLNLVNDLLDFARVEDGEIRASDVEFNLAAVVGGIRRLVEPLVDHYEADFEVELEVEGRRRGDPQILTRIAVNLLFNAIEAGDHGGEVRLRIDDDVVGSTEPAGEDAHPGAGDGLRLVVEDRGPGVDPEKLRPLLERRPRDDVTRTLQGRTRGLGLVICGRLARAADGSIEVERRSGGGARFVARLPFPPVA